MILYNSALSMLEELAQDRKMPPEKQYTRFTLGRFLAQDVVSAEDVPSFDNSAMDGFAVASEQTQAASEEHPVVLNIAVTVAAGEQGASVLSNGNTVEIMTGAPMPLQHFDAVARIEDVEVRSLGNGKRQIVIRRPVKAGENVRSKGTDFCVGQMIAESGTRIMPEHIMAFASVWAFEASVRRLPRVGIISTGKELVAPEQRVLRPGMIRNSTEPFLSTSLSLYGIQYRNYGTVPDDPSVFSKLLESALSDGMDIILSTGAVSMGKYDFVKASLERLGANIVFHKSAIRPGKPILVAEFPGRSPAVFFGVPGNPVSTAIGLRFFVDPYIRSIFGLEREKIRFAKLMNTVSKPEGLRCFFKAHIESDEAGTRVHALKAQASYVVSSMLKANGWVVLPETGSEIQAGTVVEIYPMHHSFQEGVF